MIVKLKATAVASEGIAHCAAITNVRSALAMRARPPYGPTGVRHAAWEDGEELRGRRDPPDLARVQLGEPERAVRAGSDVEELNSVIAPVPVITRPILLVALSVNDMLPSGPAVIAKEPACDVGTVNSVKTPPA